MTAIDIVTPFRLDGRVAVVTGASSGLGDRFTRVLHAAGATVVATARRVDRLEALAADLGDRVIPVGCDVSSDEECGWAAQTPVRQRIASQGVALTG